MDNGRWAISTLPTNFYPHENVSSERLVHISSCMVSYT